MSDSNPTNNDSPDGIAHGKPSVPTDTTSVTESPVLCYNCGNQMQFFYGSVNKVIPARWQCVEPGCGCYTTVTDPVEQDSDRANAEPKRELAPQQGSESTKLDDYFLTQIGIHLKTGEWDMEPTEMVANWSAKLLEWSRQEVIKELQAVYDNTNTGNVYLALGKIKTRIAELQPPQELSND